MDHAKEPPSYTRRRAVVVGIGVLVVLVAGLAAAGAVVDRSSGTDRQASASGLDAVAPEAPDAAGSTAPTTEATDPSETTTTTAAPTSTTTTAPALPSDQTKMARRQRISGGITPKSVVASKQGVVIAQNMMYTHTITAYAAATGEKLATIDDAVDLSAFGIGGHPGLAKGSPVEAAFTADGRYAYVSNYSMYGAGFGPEGADACTPKSGYDPSFLYRIDTSTFRIDQVIPVGVVPKYVAVTPDQSTVLVSNWCSFDLSVVDAAKAQEVARVPIGPHPRGIVVSPDSSTAYVAVMGGTSVLRVDLASRTTSTLASPGNGPRHLDISPDGQTIYVTNNGSGTVARIDVARGRVTHTVSTGNQPRSMALSADGTALYVVNYASSTVVKLRASDLTKLDEIGTDPNPIGIAYDPTSRSVWVACYGGSITVLDDSAART